MAVLMRWLTEQSVAMHIVVAAIVLFIMGVVTAGLVAVTGSKLWWLLWLH